MNESVSRIEISFISMGYGSLAEKVAPSDISQEPFKRITFVGRDTKFGGWGGIVGRVKSEKPTCVHICGSTQAELS